MSEYYIKPIDFDALLSGEQTVAEAAFGSEEKLVEIMKQMEAKAAKSGKTFRELLKEDQL